MLAYQDLGSRARWAVVLLGATIVADTVGIWFDLWEIRVIDRFLDGDVQTTAAIESSDTRQAAISLIGLALLVGTMIAFIRWFHSAYRNLAALGTTELRFKPGWAIGAWFVPFLNLWRPKQIADDIWRASDPDAPQKQGLLWRQAATTPLLTVWWITWVISTFVSNIVARIWFSADTLADYRSAARFDAASLAVDIVAAILATLVVRSLTARQSQREARLQALVAG